MKAAIHIQKKSSTKLSFYRRVWLLLNSTSILQCTMADLFNIQEWLAPVTGTFIASWFLYSAVYMHLNSERICFNQNCLVSVLSMLYKFKHRDIVFSKYKPYMLDHLFVVFSSRPLNKVSYLTQYVVTWRYRLYECSTYGDWASNWELCWERNFTCTRLIVISNT